MEELSEKSGMPTSAPDVLAEAAPLYASEGIPLSELLSAAIGRIVAYSLEGQPFLKGLDERQRQRLLVSARVLAEGGRTSRSVPVSLVIAAEAVRRIIRTQATDASEADVAPLANIAAREGLEREDVWTVACRAAECVLAAEEAYGHAQK